MARKTTSKESKPSLGARLKKWFVNIITELKRVIWPDRKKLRQSTLTVLLIIAISVVIILVFDTAITFIMRTSGMYSAKETAAETDPIVSEDAQTSYRQPLSRLSVDGLDISFEV